MKRGQLGAVDGKRSGTLVHTSPIPKLLVVEVVRMVQLLLSLVREVGDRFGRSLELLMQQLAEFQAI